MLTKWMIEKIAIKSWKNKQKRNTKKKVKWEGKTQIQEEEQ